MFCAYTMPRYQVSVYIPIGSLVLMMEQDDYIISLSSEISYHIHTLLSLGSRGDSVVERRTPVRDIQGSNPHDRCLVTLSSPKYW